MPPSSDAKGRVVCTGFAPHGGLPNQSAIQIEANSSGVAGEKFRHPKIHGGRDKALLLVSLEVLDQLAYEGFPVEPLSLGENVTVEGIDFAALRPGMLLRIGEVTVRLTTVRGPCKALDRYSAELPGRIYDRRVKSGDHSSPVWAWSGFYAAVEKPGIIRPGDAVEIGLNLTPD